MQCLYGTEDLSADGEVSPECMVPECIFSEMHYVSKAVVFDSLQGFGWADHPRGLYKGFAGSLAHMILRMPCWFLVVSIHLNLADLWEAQHLRLLTPSHYALLCKA